MPPHPASRRTRPTLSPSLVLGLGLGIALAVTLLGLRVERQARLLGLQREVDAGARDLLEVFQGTAGLLDATRAHFELMPPPDDAAFAAYLERLDLGRRAPGLRGVNLGLWLKPEEVPAVVAAAQADRSLRPEGHPDFALHPPLPPGSREPVHLVRFVFPLAGNEGALGFNSLSRAEQRGSIARVLATGQASSTGPVALAQATRPAPGLILRLPLLRPGRPHDTEAERAAALVGLLNGVWVPEEALALRLKELAPRLQVQLVDLGEAGQPPVETPLFGPILTGDDPTLQRRSARFFGRTLEFRFQPHPGHPVRALPVASLLVGGALVLVALLGSRLTQVLLQREQATASALRSTEGKLAAMLSAFPDALFVLDAEGTYLEIFAPEDLLAAPAARVAGTRLEDVLPPEPAAAILKVIRTAVATGRTQSLEYPLSVPKGPRLFDARVVPLPGPDAPPRVLWCARDITERKEAEAALRLREEEFRGFFEAAPVPMAINRLEDGSILLANASWHRLMGITDPSGPLGRATDYYAEPADRPAFLQEVREKGSVVRREFRLRRPSGVEVDTLLSSVRIHFAGEEVLLNAFLDLTELRRSEAALRQAQKLESMGLLAGGIAHDFNNLLTALQGNLDLALEGPAEKIPQRLEAARMVLERATVLTRQLLVYSGRMPVQREALDLGKLTREMAALLQVSIPKAVQLEMDLPEGLPSVVGDRAQLQQAVMNLVTNAADAIGPRAGRITLRLRAADLAEEDLGSWRERALSPGPHLLLSVSDDGSGMAPEVQARIFDPFFSTKEQGRGLGLSALLGILRAHKGGLHIHSLPGEGSSFTLALPASAVAASQLPEAPPPPARFQGAVLVVDDEAPVRASAGALLASLGMEVHLADGGAAGLAQARQLGDHLSLVLLDLTMPPPDGRETYAALRAWRPELPIILSSGYTDAAPGALGRDPHLGFLPKPYTLLDLRAALAERLARA